MYPTDFQPRLVHQFAVELFSLRNDVNRVLGTEAQVKEYETARAQLESLQSREELCEL